MFQNNLVRITMPIMIRTTGKKRSSRIPGMIRKGGMRIIISNTNSRAPKKRRPAISRIPKISNSMGTFTPSDQVVRWPKKFPIAVKRLPIPGRLMSQPLLPRIHKTPKMINT